MAATLATITGRPLRFLVVGGLNTVFGWGVYWTFVHLLDAHYLKATIPTFAVTTSVGWYLQRRFVFGTASGVKTSYARFMLVQVANWGLTLAPLAGLVWVGKWLGLRPDVAADSAYVVLTLLIAGITYVVHDKFTFRATRQL